MLCCQDSARKHTSLLRFNVEGMEALDVGTILDVDHGIASQTVLRCAPMVHGHLGTDASHGAARFGIAPLNTEAHTDAAIRAVTDIAEMQEKCA